MTRGRAIFSGFAFSPNLIYNLAIDYTTVSDSQINFWTYWLGYKFNRGLSLFIGQSQVPGSREWMTPAIYLLGPDYSLATTFFRPSLSQGIWASGEPLDGLNYRVMLSNGFNTLGTSPNELDSRMTFSGTVWAEPTRLRPRFFGLRMARRPGGPLRNKFHVFAHRGPAGRPESAGKRRHPAHQWNPHHRAGRTCSGSDAQYLPRGAGSDRPGMESCRGVSLSGEFYMRDLFNLIGNGPIPRSSIFDYGGFAQAGIFVLPQKFELYGRTSQIAGPFGYGSEYAGGLNWFFLEGKQNLRFTLDVAWVNHSPTDQARTDYRVGDTRPIGKRTQIQFFF